MGTQVRRFMFRHLPAPLIIIDEEEPGRFIT